MKVHQIIFSALPGDAITNHMLEIDARLRAWGIETSMFAQHVAPELRERVQPDLNYVPYLNQTTNWLIYHYALYTPSVYYFSTTDARRILIYHNITPAHYFRGWDRHLEMLCDVGRRILVDLNTCELALGDSEFNRQELVSVGFDPTRTGVLPIFLSQEAFDSVSTNEALRAQIVERGETVFLSVGRIVPNKALEDIIRIFGVYHRTINPQSRLYLVGSRYIEAYDRALDALVTKLGLDEAVVFTGRIPQRDLKTYYELADIYLIASHHEGFCVPVVESMYFGVPVLARKASATPETLGDAGVLFTDLDYEQVAEMAHLLVTDDALRQNVIRKQRERLTALRPENAEAALYRILKQLEIL